MNMRWILFSLSLCCILRGNGGSSPQSDQLVGPLNRRIIGGRQVTATEFPYQVAIKNRGESHSFCGGSIIDQYWVLTAAHCVRSKQASSLVVILGATDLRQAKFFVDVEKIIRHSGYGSWLNLFARFRNDIALKKNKKPVIINGVTSAITLPMQDQDFVGQTGIVSGFGATKERGSWSSQLMATSLSILSNSYCYMKYLTDFKGDSMLCAGQMMGGQDSCQGDSGGPLAVLTRGGALLAGIVSFGTGCGRFLVPGVYTRVSHFVDWIRVETRNQ